jgi:hypothetical protein
MISILGDSRYSMNCCTLGGELRCAFFSRIETRDNDNDIL